MGCDIHGFVEIIDNEGNFKISDFDFEPFNWRNYSMFSIFADVRNYNNIVSISKPRGLPNAINYEGLDDYIYSTGCHSTSWLTAKELLNYDYSKNCKDELPIEYFDILEQLKNLHEDPEGVRIVFWFDN